MCFISQRPAPATTRTPASSQDGLTSAELLINKNLTIDGGGQKLVIQRLSGNFRIFNVSAGTTVTLSGLTIQSGGGASTSAGGGVASGGNLTVINCTFRDNSAASGEGGAIYNVGVLRVSNSTLNGNSAPKAGAISNGPSATMQIDNCTVSGNDSVSLGGSLGAVLNRGSAAAARMRNTIVVETSPPGYDERRFWRLYLRGL